MKTVLITGATAGIGWETALKFNQKGFRLILCGRRKERLEELQKKLQVPSHLLNVDVREYAHLKQELAALPSEFVEIEILINNAALALGRELAYEAHLEDWEIVVDTNIKGVMGYTHAILPQMVARNAGHIINIGSVVATNPYMGGHVYGGSKAFVHQFSRNLRNDLAGTNVRVSIVAPGIVESEFMTVCLRGNKEAAKAKFEDIQALQPQDVAEAIFWVTQQPPNVNVNLVELMCLGQAPGNMSTKPLARKTVAKKGDA